jgi:hypothetical protein
MTVKLTRDEKHNLKLFIINHPFSSNNFIAERWGCAPRTVVKAKEELGIPSSKMRKKMMQEVKPKSLRDTLLTNLKL